MATEEEVLDYEEEEVAPATNGAAEGATEKKYVAPKTCG